MSLIHNSGFIDNLDDFISRKFPLFHLPMVIRCCLCSTWWLSLAYVWITGHLCLTNILLSLIVASLTTVIRPAFMLVETILQAIILNINKQIEKYTK